MYWTKFKVAIVNINKQHIKRIKIIIKINSVIRMYCKKINLLYILYSIWKKYLLVLS